MPHRDKLTESQRNLFDAIMAETIEIKNEVMAEIEKLRTEQVERHRRGMVASGDTVPNIKKVDGASLDINAALNRWQGITRAAEGNLKTVVKEIQRYLVEGVLPNKKQ